MNSPLFLGVVIKPDNADGKQVEPSAYGEDPNVVNGQAMRDWQKEQAAWDTRHPDTRVEPPMHDLYVCARRLNDPAMRAYLNVTYGLDIVQL